RKVSNRSRKTFARSWSGPPPRFGPPATTTRVGSPPVCESITEMRSMARPRFSPLWSGGDGGADEGQHFLTFLADQRQPRSAGEFGAVAALGRGELDVLHQLRVRVEVQHWRVPAVHGAGLVPLPGPGQVPEQAILAGEGVHQPAHPADGPED